MTNLQPLISNLHESIGMKTVRIGGGLGGDGDSFLPALDLIQSGATHYVCFDHLSKLTLATLQQEQRHDSRLGYDMSLIPMLHMLWEEALRHDVKLITNAGALTRAMLR